MSDIEKLRELICDDCHYVYVYTNEDVLRERHCNNCLRMKKLNELENIVHCNDCVHWKHDTAGCIENVGRCEFANWMIEKNGFCLYATEKEKEYQYFEDDVK